MQSVKNGKHAVGPSARSKAKTALVANGLIEMLANSKMQRVLYMWTNPVHMRALGANKEWQNSWKE